MLLAEELQVPGRPGRGSLGVTHLAHVSYCSQAPCYLVTVPAFLLPCPHTTQRPHGAHSPPSGRSHTLSVSAAWLGLLPSHSWLWRVEPAALLPHLLTAQHSLSRITCGPCHPQRLPLSRDDLGAGPLAPPCTRPPPQHTPAPTHTVYQSLLANKAGVGLRAVTKQHFLGKSI